MAFCSFLSTEKGVNVLFPRNHTYTKVKVEVKYSFKYTHSLIISLAISLCTFHTYRQAPSSLTHLDFTACRCGTTFLLSVEVFWEQGPNKSSVEEEQTKADRNNYRRSGA